MRSRLHCYGAIVMFLAAPLQAQTVINLDWFSSAAGTIDTVQSWNSGVEISNDSVTISMTIPGGLTNSVLLIGTMQSTEVGTNDSCAWDVGATHQKATAIADITCADGDLEVYTYYIVNPTAGSGILMAHDNGVTKNRVMTAVLLKYAGAISNAVNSAANASGTAAQGTVTTTAGNWALNYIVTAENGTVTADNIEINSVFDSYSSARSGWYLKKATGVSTVVGGTWTGTEYYAYSAFQIANNP